MKLIHWSFKDIPSNRNNPFDGNREVGHYSWFSIIIKNIENGYYSVPCKPTICVEDDVCFFATIMVSNCIPSRCTIKVLLHCSRD